MKSIALAVSLLACSAGAQEWKRVSLCEALASVQRGEQMAVETTGIYIDRFETTVLYDPQEPRCRQNVQPATWIEFAPKAKFGALSAALDPANRAYVVVRGYLHGARPPSPDAVALPAQVASGIRVNNAYGHLSAFRTKLVVSEVVSSEAVPASIPWLYEWNVLPAENVIRVLAAEVPLYPRFARHGNIEGVVEVRVSVKDGRVVGADVLTGERILSDDTLKNIRTWQFAPGTEASFVTRFLYELERREAGANTNPRIDMQLPTFVRVIGARNDW